MCIEHAYHDPLPVLREARLMAGTSVLGARAWRVTTSDNVLPY